MTEKKYLEAVSRLDGAITPVRKIDFPKLQITTAQEAIDLLTVIRYSCGDLTNGMDYDIKNEDALLEKLMAAIKKGLV